MRFGCWRKSMVSCYETRPLFYRFDFFYWLLILYLQLLLILIGEGVKDCRASKDAILDTTIASKIMNEIKKLDKLVVPPPEYNLFEDIIKPIDPKTLPKYAEMHPAKAIDLILRQSKLFKMK